MAYNEELTNRVREALSNENVTEEVKMFQGVCFMVDDKMCICVRDQILLCRIGRDQAAIELEKGDCKQMMSGDRPMKDFVWVDEEQVKTVGALNYWVKLALTFNKIAKKRVKVKGKRTLHVQASTPERS